MIVNAVSTRIFQPMFGKEAKCTKDGVCPNCDELPIVAEGRDGKPVKYEFYKPYVTIPYEVARKRGLTD